MSKQQIISIKAEDGKAIIYLKGRIGRYWNDSDEFGWKVDGFVKEGITDLDIYINSPGGDAIEANEIANIIKRFKGTVRGFGGALVASAVTYIACHCDTFEMAENGQYMYHKPYTSLEGNVDEIKARLKILENITANYVKTYARKTGKSEAEILEAMKQDVWLSASEAKEQGFIDGITDATEIDAKTQAEILACGCPTLPNITAKKKSKTKILSPKVKEMSFDKSLLGLKADATTEEVEAKIKALNDSAKAAKGAKAEYLVNAAITAKKITADEKAEYLELAQSNYTLAEKIFAKKESVEAISLKLETTKPVVEAGEDRSKWGYDTWADKAYDELVAMSENDTKKYDALVKAKVGEK